MCASFHPKSTCGCGGGPKRRGGRCPPLAVAILRAALQGEQSGAGRNEAIDRLRAIRRRTHLGAGAQLAEELVREDRERSG